MANSYAELAESTGPKIQMFENTIGGNTVQAMAVKIQNPSGWSRSYVQVAPDSTGKKFQYFENTINGQVVNAIALVVVDTSGSSVYG